jgi:NADH-quinone oxidoreductase subunit E
MDIPADLLAKIDEAISHYPVSKRSASLPLLHLWQEHFGYISDEAITWIAAKLGLQPINILELVTFYPMFRRQPAGRKHIRICRTLSCALAGAYELREKVAKAAGIDLEAFEAEQKKTLVHGHPHNPGHGNPIAISKDGQYSMEFVECLASCGSAPVAMVGDLFKENISLESAAELLGVNKSDATLPKVKAPHPRERRLVFKHIDEAGYTPDIECYQRHGGYETLKKAFAMKPEDITEEVKKSGLQAWRAEADVPDLQCGRVGARHVQGSLHHPPGSASVAGGDDHLLLRGRCEPRVHLHSR